MSQREPTSPDDRASCPTNGWWGNELKPKNPTSFRIGFQNINGFTIDNADEKSHKINELFRTKTLDVLGIQEINLHLRILGSAGHWQERNRPFTSGFTHGSTNAHCNSDTRRLFGGTGMYMTHQATHRAISHGNDPTGLGRWSWTLLRGKGNISTRIISGYRPCKSTTDNTLTVHAQHELYFRQHGGWRDPRSAFFEDIDSQMSTWLNNGEQIVIGFDLNDDVRGIDINRWRTKWNLCDSLSRLHGQPNIATCRSNSSNIPIDTIWSSFGLDITNGGMSGFGSLDLGSADHRLLWIDIEETSMFGFRPPAPAKRPTDSIPLNDPKVVTRYNNFVRRERHRHRIPERVYHIEKRALAKSFDEHDAQEYEQILLLDSGIRTQAKKQCRPFFTGQVPYSDVIGRDRKEIHLWLMVIAYRQGQRTDSRAIRRLMVQTGVRNALQLSLDEAEAAQTACQTRYKANKLKAAELAEAFRLKVCERRAHKLNTSIEAQEKILRNNRRQGGAYQKINRILQRKQRASISTVEYTDTSWTGAMDDPTAPTIKCYTQDDIEAACAKEGQRRFGQSATTPFLQGSLLQDLGFLATQSTVDCILTGSYDCAGDVDQHTRDFIAQLKMPESITHAPVISGHVSTSAHISGWKRMRSTISSSPFGPVFSDYIAGCDDIRVADIDAACASIPVLTGYCPKAWQQAVDVMIPKKSTSAHVTKLRIIVLFHALFNMVNKNVGRLAVKRAEEHNLIPAEAYGSRPGRRANICALNKVLTYDVLRQRRLPAALCSNDAVSCYDRIVHAIASICLQRMGVDAGTCRLMFGTLQDIEHHVATAYGVSATSYGAVEIPLQGVGQGNGAGPAIWLIITVPLINMLRDKGFGFRSTTVLTGEEYQFVCYTFVDDTDTVHSTTDLQADHRQVLSDMQAVIDTWEGGLRATGGALSLKKSYWYLMEFKWIQHRQKWEYCSIDETPGGLTIWGDSTITRSVLRRYETDHAEETLGLWIAPDANQRRQVESLHDKIATWCDKIRTKHLSQSLAWLSITSGISMSVKYPLTATNLSKKDCRTITQPFLDVALPALGLPRKMPHALVFAPKKYLGFGIFDLWLQQGVDQIQACLDYGHRRGGDITGHLLRDVMQTLRLELGRSGHPMSYSYKQFHQCTTPTKLHTIWEFGSSHNFILRDGLAPLPTLRHNDRFLMDIFTDAGYSPKELAIINRCRMHLRISLLSEICNGDGSSLCSGMTTRRTPPDHRTQPAWPKTGTPDNNAWNMWRNALIDCCLIPNANNLRLRQPLGPWYGMPTRWTWYFSELTNCVYQVTPEGNIRTYRKEITHHCTRSPIYYLQGTTVTILPPSAVPTTITGTTTRIRHTGTTTVGSPPRPHENDRWWGLVIQAPDDFTQLVQGICNGTAVGIADGSFKDGMGTAGYTLLPAVAIDDQFILVNNTPGLPEDIDPYRAELAGIYGIVATAAQLCTSYNITSGSITIGCDCESALRNLSSTFEPSPGRPHHDLLTSIRYMMEESPLTWAFRHVRGHQDATTSYDNLDRWAQLNVDMDQLAKAHWKILDNHRPAPFHLPPFPGQWSIWYNEYRLPCWTLERAQTIYYLPPVSKFWDKRLRCPNAVFRYDWPSSALALRRLPTHQRLWIPKWLCSTLPTGNNLVRWGYPDLLPCPRCGEDEDHRHHVITCPHADSTAIRQRLFEQLGSFLDTSSTEPDLKLGLLSLFESVISNLPWNPVATSSEAVQHTYDDQQLLGPSFVLDGFLSPYWARTQQTYYESIGRKTTGTQWAGRVIRKIWEIAWELWLHRRHVKESTDNQQLPALHSDIDARIDRAYEDYLLSPDPSLVRWFFRPSHELHRETLDWKARWLEMISAIYPTD